MGTHIVEDIAEAEVANSMLLRQLIRPRHRDDEMPRYANEQPQAATPTELSAMIAAARRMIEAR
ncbi:MAG TPA: hypothetical protein VNT30_22160 [Stellaceae bacterium]|nr:hypothetical protein [Stellaceae bacterium]